MAVDWEGILAGLVPVVVGIAIGFLLTPASEVWSNRLKRKKLAAVLACEVEAIRAMAAQSIEVNEPNVAITRKTLDMVGLGGAPLSSVAVDDVDYPREVFDSSLGDVEILGEDVMRELTELYRWVAFAHHAKRRNLQSHTEFMDLAKVASGRGSGPTALERDIMSNDALATVMFATVYLADQKRILELAAQAVADLERLGKTTVAGKVSVSTGEPLRASTPRR